MIVRFVLLVVLAVAMVTGRLAASDFTADTSAELTELGVEEAVMASDLASAAVLDARIASPAPPLVHGTEVEHPSPPAARLFRPPRDVSVGIA